jgi:hypothetical protein
MNPSGALGFCSRLRATGTEGFSRAVCGDSAMSALIALIRRFRSPSGTDLFKIRFRQFGQYIAVNRVRREQCLVLSQP